MVSVVPTGARREARHRGGVLPEVEDERLALVERHRRHLRHQPPAAQQALPAAVAGVGAHLLDRAERLCARARDALPDVGLDRRAREVVAPHDGRGVARQDLALEFVVDDRGLRGLDDSPGPARVVDLAVEDAGAHDGIADVGRPLRVGDDLILRAVVVGKRNL